MSSDSLTSTELLGAASRILESAGYARVVDRFPDWAVTGTRLFEDPYCIVGLAVFETCEELLARWPDLQGSLVEALTAAWSPTDAKAWDGYLVLMTPSEAPSEHSRLEAIRYDVTRVQKLLASGEELASLADVERLLRPLLPLGIEYGTTTPDSALELLPPLLAEKGVPERTTTALIEAFVQQEPLLEAIHACRSAK